MDFYAEREGFEPPVPRGTTVFKTAAFDHSAIPPGAKLVKKCKRQTKILSFFDRVKKKSVNMFS